MLSWHAQTFAAIWLPAFRLKKGLDDMGLLLYAGLTLIPAWISNYMPSKVRSGIIHPFPNFIGVAVEVWNGKVISPTLNNGCNYLCMLGLKLVHVSKSGGRCLIIASMIIMVKILLEYYEKKSQKPTFTVNFAHKVNQTLNISITMRQWNKELGATKA